MRGQGLWCDTQLSPLPPGPQYGSLERAWGAIMTEADKVSELHQEVKNSLLNDDFEKVKNWQKDAYHKQIMGGFKEAKEAEDGFRKAQKPWAKKLKEVREAQHVLGHPWSSQLWVPSPGWGTRGHLPAGRGWTGAVTLLSCPCSPLRSWRQPRKPTTWPARRRSWPSPGKPTARQSRTTPPSSRRNCRTRWKSASRMCKRCAPWLGLGSPAWQPASQTLSAPKGGSEVLEVQPRFPPAPLQTQEKYEKVLDELNKCTPQYIESMEQVFEQCQQFEEKRLNFLKEVLLDIKRHLNLAESSRWVPPRVVSWCCPSPVGTGSFQAEPLLWLLANMMVPGR